MSTERRRRVTSLLAVLATAVLGGAAAAVVGAVFLWLVERITHLLWDDLPDRVGVDPFDSWWLFAIPIAGGVLVGLGQRLLGNHPEPIQQTLAKWRAGGHVDPATVPATGFNSLTALVAGGPVGFEAALTGLIGGVATLISERMHRAGRLVRQAWGAERVDGLPHIARTLPYWLAGVAGLVTYHSLPFGSIGLEFRFQRDDGLIGVDDALVAFAFAALVTVPVAWAVAVVSRAEEATMFRRGPVRFAVAAAVLFAALALVQEDVLFSGQQAIQHLDGLPNGDLLYLTVAKWVALLIAYLGGWRGGPIFPLFFSVSSFAVLLDGPLGVPADVVMIAGIAAVSTVFARGSIPIAFVLSLYVVPVSYALTVLIGATAGAIALRMARARDVLPTAGETPAPAPAGP